MNESITLISILEKESMRNCGLEHEDKPIKGGDLILIQEHGE